MTGTMQSQPDEKCATCGKPFPKKGSMTQWIFDFTGCSCAKVSGERRLPHCALCGLPIKTKLGSMTHWIFRTKTCSCLVATESEEPLVSHVLPSDDLIAGAPYSFVSITGSGGIASVYKAINRKLERPVAIKILHASANESKASRNFEREAKSVSKLQHPNVLTVQDFGVMRDGRQFLVTEWIEGLTLDQYLKRHGPLSVDVARELFSQVLDGLSHAHNRGVVHRDIKPSNIMLTRGESGGWIVKIIDFGTAKEIDKESATSTHAEDLACSPYYMSPEHATGEQVDHRSDLYSVGCSLFEALTGRPPFIGGSLSVVMRHQLETPPSLRLAAVGAEFPMAIELVVEKLLAKTPSDRFQNTLDAKVALNDRSGISLKRIKKEPTTKQSDFEPQMPETTRPLLLALAGFIGVTCLFYFVKQFNELSQDAKPDRKPMTVANPWRQPRSTKQFVDPISEAGINSKIEKNGTLTVHVGNDLVDVGYDDERLLSEMHKRNLKNVSNLAIVNVPITGRLFLALKNEPIDTLELQSTKLDAEGLESISKIKTIRVLILEENPELTSQSLSNLATMPNLQWLVLGKCKIDLDDLKVISRCRNIVHLNLNRNPLVDGNCLKYIVTVFPNLDTLDVSSAAVKPDDFSSLALAKRLRHLGLCHLNLDNAELNQLPNIPLLNTILLEGNFGIDDKGLLSLLRFKNLQVVGVSKTSVTEKGQSDFRKRKPNCSFL